MTAFAPYHCRLESLSTDAMPGEVVEARRRAGVVAIARACAGLSFASDPARYATLLFPLDDPARARAMAKSMSSCAVFALAVLRLAGVEHPHLAAPYASRLGKAVSDVLAVGADLGALRKPTPDASPAPGDIVLIGQNGAPKSWVRGTGAGEHVLVVTGIDDDIVDSCDGGQPGLERRSRRLVRVGSEMWLATLAHRLDPDGRPNPARRIVAYLDVASLPTTRPAMVPDGAALPG